MWGEDELGRGGELRIGSWIMSSATRDRNVVGCLPCGSGALSLTNAGLSSRVP